MSSIRSTSSGSPLIPAMPPSRRPMSVKLASGRATPASWARARSASAGGRERGAEAWKTSASRSIVGEHLLRELALGRGVAHEAAEPLRERVPRRQVDEIGGLAGERLDLVEVDGLEQVLAGREVAVERGRADRGRAARSRRASPLLPCSAKTSRATVQQLLVVAPRVRALGSPVGEGGERDRVVHGVRPPGRLKNGDTLRILTGEALRYFWRVPPLYPIRLRSERWLRHSCPPCSTSQSSSAPPSLALPSARRTPRPCSGSSSPRT